MGITWKTLEAEQALRLTYRQILEREIDPRGLTDFTKKLVNDDRTLRSVVEGIGRSDEYGRNFVNPHLSTRDPGMAVRLMYRHFLKRAPENETVVGQHLGHLLKHGYKNTVSNIVNGNEYATKWGDNGVPGIGPVPTGGRSVPSPRASHFTYCISIYGDNFDWTITATSKAQADEIIRKAWPGRYIRDGKCRPSL